MMVGVYRKSLVWVLAVSMVASPTWAYAQQAQVAEPAAKPDLSYVTPDAVLAVVAHPRRVLTSPQMEMLPVEVMSAAGKKEVGIDPVDIEKVMAIVEPPVAGPPGYGVVIRLAAPYQLDALKLPPNLSLTDAELDGRLYRQSQNPMMPGFYMPDDRTLLVASDAVLKKMLANHKSPVEGPLSRLMARTAALADVTAIAVVEPVRPMLSAMLAQAPVPPPLEGVKRLPELIDAAKADLAAGPVQGFSLVLLAPDESAAEELQGLLNQYLDLGQQMAMAQITSEMKGDDPVEQATLRYTQRITQRMIDIFRPQRTGKMLRVSLDGGPHGQIATIGILVALLLPAVQAAREAARRTQSRNNLKQIALAMHNHHDAKGTFPPRASFDEQGKPLLSWRVHILPYIEQQALYEQFHLDEPWDSEHNKQLIDRMPALYKNPSSPTPMNRASYLVPAGPGLIFEGPKGTSMRDITDGMSNTLLALEVNNETSVVWTKPVDLEYDPDDPLAGLGKAHPGGFNAATADGAVHFILITIDPQVFRNLLMKADGQTVGQF